MTDVPAMIAEILELDEKASKGPWRWLSHDCFTEGEKRVWRYVESKFEYDQERQLTSANPGDLHRLSDGLEPVMESVSAGYGGETDISIGDSDAALISHYRTSAPKIARALRIAIEALEVFAHSEYPEVVRDAFSAITAELGERP